MSKKNDTPAIEVGKTISMEDTSRKGLTQQICELVSKAEKQGLRAHGGFIEYDGGERFTASITFVKP
jgi:hypothetical protein